MLIFQFRILTETGHWLERAAAYTLCTFIIYLDHSSNNIGGSTFAPLVNSYFALLAVAVVMGFQFSKTKDFTMTPLDFLVIFIAFAIPNLPGLNFGQNIGVAIAKIIVLFYAVELILNYVKAKPAMVKSTMIFMFSFLAVKAFL